MSNKIQLDTIEDALTAISKGKIVIVVDDEDRENEGDFICAAEHITPDIVNFMALHGRGLICTSISEKRCQELGLQLMVKNNTALHETPFTVSVDLIGHGCTTGISAHDRAKTIQALCSTDTLPGDLGKPGHIFPLMAKNGGVLRRAGHTEAALDLARLSGCAPAGVLVEILNPDGSMARLPELRKLADDLQLKLVSIADLIKYRLEKESIIAKEKIKNIPSEWMGFDINVFRQINTEEFHMAMILGTWEKEEVVPVRVHSSSVLGDLYAGTQDTKGLEIYASMEMIKQHGKGVILYINQEGEENIYGNQYYQRDYGVGAQILRNLGIEKVQLISNTNHKPIGLIGHGLEIVGYLSIKSVQEK